jgi:DNA-binding NarL/FixJ family response regulator
VTIRVLVADDQPLVRAGLVMLLNAEPDIDVVAEADDGAAAVSLAKQHAPDVVVMDVRMPHIDGVTATRSLTSDPAASDPDHLIRVLMLTTFNEDAVVYAALRAGASGFLLKHAAPQDLVDAIRAVARGEAWLAPAVAVHVINALASAQPQYETNSAFDHLTAREREVLALMAQGLSNGEIRERLVVSEATVKTHVARVLMKTGSRDRTRAVVTAYQCGLVVPGTGGRESLA